MGKASDSYKIGDLVYVIFYGDMRKDLLKPVRKGKVFFVEYRVIEVDGNKVIAKYGKQLCEDEEKYPYGGCGIVIEPGCYYAFSREEFEAMRLASDDELKSLCEKRGFKHRVFRKAFEPFRLKNRAMLFGRAPI